MFCKKILASMILAGGFSQPSYANSESSYQEEFVFLNSQLSALKNRKKKTLSQLRDMEFKLKKSVSDLNFSVSKLESENETLQTKLSKFDETRSDEQRNIKKIEVVTSQMQDFSKNHNYDLGEFERLNTNVLSFLQKGAKEHTETGSAFDEKGVKVEGEIHHLGHVATYFADGDDYIALATNPSKTGMMFTDHQIAKDQLLSISGSIKKMPVSLKEGILTKEKSFGEVVRAKLDSGGAVGFVILFLGFIGIGIAFLRYSLNKTYSGFDEDDVSKLVQNIQSGNLDEAKKLLNEQKSSPVNRFIDLLLSCRHKTDEVYEVIVVSEISKIQNTVSKFGPYLLVLAAVAPLLGLLGTVTGMIGTFDMITIHGTGNPKILSGGIKEALVTTQMGLIVAIPCILAGNYLSSKALKVVSKFEEVASSIPKV